MELRYCNTCLFPETKPDLFFNNSSKFILIGLDPIGTLPSLIDKKSLNKYFSTINKSLNAILKFSMPHL